MLLIRSSELYCFGIRIQKNCFYRLYRSRTNYKRLNNLNIKKLPEQKLHGLSLKRSFICCISFINFIAVAVFINCSSSQQYHYSSRTCCYFGKYLTSKEILATYTLELANNINKY